MLQEKFYNGVKILSVNKKEIEKKLREISREIKKDENVQKVILFGSILRADFYPLSDIDIAIILKKTSKRFIERQDDFIDFFNDLKLDVNIVVYTEEEFQGMLEEKNNFVLNINKGKFL